MTKREARRLALLIIDSEIRGSIDVSDEWRRHPETDAELSLVDARKVMAEAHRFLASLTLQIDRLDH
jgi:hypothetical protein